MYFSPFVSSFKLLLNNYLTRLTTKNRANYTF